METRGARAAGEAKKPTAGFQPGILTERHGCGFCAQITQTNANVLNRKARGRKWFADLNGQFEYFGKDPFAKVFNPQSATRNRNPWLAAGERPSGCGLLGRFGFGFDFFAFEVGGAALAFLGFVVLFSHNSLHFSLWSCLLAGIMKSCSLAFNIFLAAAAAALCGGCGTKRLDLKKGYAKMDIFLESKRGAASGAMLVHVTRENFPVYVDPEPFLTEEDLDKATLVDGADGTYSIQLVFGDHGKLVLDMTTTSSRGSRMVIYAMFPPPGWVEPKEGSAFAAEKTEPGKARASGWLSMVPINRGLTGGVLQFTPDATHEEAERIVKGLNHMAKAEQQLGQ